MLLLSNSVSVLMPGYRKILNDKYGRDNVHLRAHGLLARRPEFPDFSRRGAPVHRILAFGKWGTYKRLELMIEAFNLLSEKLPQARLIIAGGDHPQAAGYVDSIRKTHAGNAQIEFRGYVPEGDLPDLFQSASVTVMNGLMASPSWKDSVFILTYDEAGGLYDHVPPQPAVNPDGIAPMDLLPGDICTTPGGANCDFNYTGFRVPLIVVSPFTKKNYVSHTVADYTAILTLIEKRFGISALTQRDAAQMDMTEFFDFQNVPWATPPTPPAQATGGVCSFQNLGYPGP